MRLLYQAAALLRVLFRHERVDADLGEEVRFHIERETQANIARGMPPDDAYRAARLTFGSVDDAVERARTERPGSLARETMADVRFGMRLLAKSPAFALAATVIIAVGVGAVTSVFSVVYGVMLHPLPYREPDRLVSLWSTSPTAGAEHLYPNAADIMVWRRSSRALEDIAFVRAGVGNLNLLGVGEPARLQGARVSTNLFSVLGVAPALGRPFASDEGRDGHDHVIILSDDLWRTRFGADRSIVGRSIRLNGESYSIIGVMAPTFAYPTREYQAWVPLVVDPRELVREVTQNYSVVGRMRAGVDVAQTRREMAAINRRMQTEFPATNRSRDVMVVSMLDDVIRDVRPTLIALLAASLSLVLIACLNLSSLLGGRAAARHGEFAVRLALGSSRTRLVRQVVAEVMPILVLGGAMGLLVAIACVRGFLALAPVGLPRLESVAVNTPVIFAALTLIAIAGVIAALAPATQAWRSDFTTMTKDGGRGSTAGRRRASFRRLGVAAQIAVAVPMIVGAGLLIRTAIRLAAVELGFATDGVAIFHVAVPRGKYATDADVAAFYDRVLLSVAAVPGVSHAGLVNRVPLDGNQTMSVLIASTAGAPLALDGIDSRPATPDYFAALGIPLREGRTFTTHDDAAAPGVAIIDDRLAHAAWPGQSALGKRIRRFDGVWCTVVGVVGHVHANAVDADPRSQIYWSHHQVTQDRMVLVVRGAADATALMKPVVDAIHAVDADQPVYEVRSMVDVVDRSLVQRRLAMQLIAAFGAIALGLAAVGIYGVVSYGVTQRRREFGVRLALGATPGAVTRFVVRDGLTMATLGCAVGLGAALAVGSAMSNLVYGVSSRDALSLAGAVVILFGVTIVASYLPARRAAAIDPAVTLRTE